MQAARREKTSWEEMALEPIDQNQQTTHPDIGLSPYPGMVFSGHFEHEIYPNLEVTGPDTQFEFWNSAATLYPNTDLANFSAPGLFIADFPVEGPSENGYSTAMNMHAIELDFFNGFPSVGYSGIITPSDPAPMLGPAIYPPPFVNPDSASYLPAQAPVQQPVLPSGQQAPQRTTCTRCPRTFSRRSDLPRHMASVHGVGRRAHQCPRSGCGKTYSRSDKVLEHRRNAGH
ncbi:uncharacterized protein EAF02_007642 [Botrytis sinoallii]|uniref:uncharacterized protein n=1 Tax=Botrytis sinoallii TaxID=1463999 RepID=UPI001900DFB3|nr:uncharacterized protein EAF02_007642 [Botrytis sinoallii]KAF7880005.1 hypothetical protein EAF02_007642 [Botrytis sinoallii]